MDTDTPKAARAGAALIAENKAKLQDALSDTTHLLSGANESVNHITGEAMSCLSDNLNAAMESANQASRSVSEISKSYLDSFNGVMNSWNELAREGAACKTPEELIALQKKGFDPFKTFVEASFRFYGDLFSAYVSAVQPMLTRSAESPQRLLRAMAD
ncbi:MAG: hypothetical protein ACTHLA_07900 [Asticcacaulis sp.]|uniref:hypothetical protein n=1 Tax=Asticcacaulis sp. TaxID=1872648 RepID=UPI003F7B45D2